jgi:hypothetical protein
MYEATFEVRQAFDGRVLTIYSVHSREWRAPYTPLVWDPRCLGGLKPFQEQPPFNQGHCAIYQDHCTYHGSDDAGFARIPDRVCACVGMTVFLESHTDDPSLDAAREILSSKEFAEAVPWQSINFTGERFEVHIQHSGRSLNPFLRETFPQELAECEAPIRAVHRRLIAEFGLRPNPNATSVNQLFHAENTWIVKGMAHEGDLATRTRVETVGSRTTAWREVDAWLKDTLKRYPAPPVTVFPGDELEQQEEALCWAFHAMAPVPQPKPRADEPDESEPDLFWAFLEEEP